MTSSQTCRRSGGNSRSEAEQRTDNCGQTAAEQAVRTTADVPMCRHINPIADGCDMGRQLWQLNRMMEVQNRILAQLLQATQEKQQ